MSLLQIPRSGPNRSGLSFRNYLTAGLLAMLAVLAVFGPAGSSIPLVSGARATQPSSPSNSIGQYLVEFNGQIPDDLPNRIATLNGVLIEKFPEIRVALVGNLTAEAANVLATQADVADVTLDEPLLASDFNRDRRETLMLTSSTPSGPETASWYPYQWNLRAISADAAWRAGYLGRRDVKIAVIDTGIDPANSALAGLIDTVHSRSFCPAEDASGTDREFDGNGNLVPGICSSGGYDLVGSLGTSAAAPHVSGLAALLVGKLGHGRAAQVRAAIENSVDDLGRIGTDPFYGRGRINVGRALALP